MALKFTLFLIGCLAVTVSFGASVTHVELDTVQTTDSVTPREGKCNCAVFKASTDPQKTNPIVEKEASMNIKHDDTGRELCRRACIKLAEAAKARAPWVLCAALNEDEVSNLKVQVYSRICKDDLWVDTGKTSTHPICCLKEQPIDCDTKSNLVPINEPTSASFVQQNTVKSN